MILGGSGTISSDKITSDANGNFGVGTTTPAYKLDIRDNTTGQQLRLSSSHGNGTSMAFDSSSANGRVWRIGSNYVDGYGEFAIYDATASLRRLNIDSSGRVTKPYQSFFRAYPPTSYSVASSDTIIGSTWSVVTNTGNNFNTNGTYTAPITGVYSFVWNVFLTASSSRRDAFIYVNGSIVARDERNGYSSSALNTSASISLIIYLNAGDYVQFGALTGSTYTSAPPWQYACGYLLG